MPSREGGSRGRDQTLAKSRRKVILRTLTISTSCCTSLMMGRSKGVEWEDGERVRMKGVALRTRSGSRGPSHGLPYLLRNTPPACSPNFASPTRRVHPVPYDSNLNFKAYTQTCRSRFHSMIQFVEVKASSPSYFQLDSDPDLACVCMYRYCSDFLCE